MVLKTHKIPFPSSPSLNYIVGEEHPEMVFLSAINFLDESLPDELRFQRNGSSDVIQLYQQYQRVLESYFFRVKENGNYYIDSSKEIHFDRTTEEQFWLNLFGAVEGLSSICPSEVEPVMGELRRACNLFTRKTELIREYKPDVIFLEGIGPETMKESIFGISGIVYHAAMVDGIDIVHLDDGFAPYLDGVNGDLSTKIDASKGREEYWVTRIMNSPTYKVSLMFVGLGHLLGKDSPFPHTGNLLHLLSEQRLSYQTLEFLC